MEGIFSSSNLGRARRGIDEALRHLYLSRLLLEKQSPQLSRKMLRMEVELYHLMDDIESMASKVRASSWWVERP